MNKGKFLALLVMTSLFVMAGCSSSGGSRDGDDDGSSGRYGDGSGLDGASLQQMLNTKVIYFDFDASTIRSEYFPVLRAHAQKLSDSGRSLTIQGHGDERGTREYNIGLGERRANAVRRYLISQGVSSSQIDTVSYGEERPESYGHNEAAWSQNRRAVLDY